MRAAKDPALARERTELEALLGKKSADDLATLDIHTTWDLLHHYPRRYVEREQVTPLGEGRIGEDVTYVARVKSKDGRQAKGGKLYLTTIVFTDGTNEVLTTFFSKHANRANKFARELKVGEVAMIAGRLGVNKYQRDANARLRAAGKPPSGPERELVHPDVRPLSAPAEGDAAAARPVPIYPATKACPSWRTEAKVQLVLDPLRPEDVSDPIPDDLRASAGLMTLHDALRHVHQPATLGHAQQARHTLRYHEAFVLQAALARRRLEARGFDATPHRIVRGGLVEAFDSQLPFLLTEGQGRVAEELSADLAQPRPMQRLLQGEVGSGKTVLALRAMLQIVDGGGQAALLAPTEVLAQQHARSIEALLGPLSDPLFGGLISDGGPHTRVALLTGSMPTARRRAALLAAASGEAGIVVGTHALLSENVQFADLGLVVVDEQHRFGVEQRDALRAKAEKVPHLLVMTATPIPRSVAMTVFGDVDTSTLRELPGGRLPITTHVVPQLNKKWMDRVWERVAEQVASGARAYVVAPRIGEGSDEDGLDLVTEADLTTAEGAGEPDRSSDGAAGDDLFAAAAGPRPEPRSGPDLTSVLEVAPQLAAHPALAGIEIGIMHGRLAPEEKDEAMARFVSGETPILVATTVIEVGVDVPDATVMVILDANFFGLSQLHQLRGRVGRGTRGGTCFVATKSETGPSLQRLETFADLSDGFAIAEADLGYRREGDVLGRSQHGRASSLRLLRVLKDAELIAEAREAALAIVEADPDLSSHPALAHAVTTLIAPEKQEFLDRA